MHRIPAESISAKPGWVSVLAGPTHPTTEAAIVDLSKLTTGDKLILGGALAYLIFMFLPWYGVDTAFVGQVDGGGARVMTSVLPSNS